MASGQGGVSYKNIAQLGTAWQALGDTLDEWQRELENSLPPLASNNNVTIGYGGVLFKEDLEDPGLAQDGPETLVLGLPSDISTSGKGLT